MKINRIVALSAIVVLAIGIGSTGTATASGANDDAEPPITGTALEQASATALAHIGSGRVTETEVGDEEGYYEVEVTLNDGSQVDVHLDENFNVLSQEADGENEAIDN
jgi:uncharacterized membrane protein YkoI